MYHEIIISFKVALNNKDYVYFKRKIDNLFMTCHCVTGIYR